MQGKKPISHFIAGLIIAGLLIVVSLVTSMTAGSASRPGGGWITYLILIGGIVFFVYQYGKAKNNYTTFGDLFSYGFKTTAIITLVFVVFLIVLSFIYPELKEKSLEAAREQAESQKGVSDADMERSLEMVKKYFWVVVIGGMILFFAIFGVIGSLIGAAITKKEKAKPLQTIDHLDQPNS
jgi:Na+/H+ antiporter NhaC